MSYKGMNWLKCDFQMQTPGDCHNWCHDDPAYLPAEHTQEQLINSVDLYLKRCYEIDLNIICVTDHNFIGRAYLEMMQERNRVIARQVEKEEIVIFPGFEIEISQGLGVHLLCIFNYDKSLQDIDDLVSNIGLIRNRRVIDGNIVPVDIIFKELVRKVQNDNDGLIIAAHPLAESGLLNDSFISEYFQREMFLNSELLAMEVPKPLGKLSRNWQRMISADSNCHREWRRERRIAAVMSSDAYRLNEGEKGFIGKRATWIKMSHPCIESLKQSFLDTDRISLQSESPQNDVRHDKIVSIKLSNTEFLDDQEINFSPNLNCIIGGRGSGKSSILEYIRLCTSHVNDETNEQLNRVRKTLTGNSLLQLVWEDKNGLIDKIEFKIDGGTLPRIISRDVEEPTAVLKNMNVKIYSQRELSNIAQQQSSLSTLIDTLSGVDLAQLKSNEFELTSKINQLFQISNRLERTKSDRRIIIQEKNELQRQWDSFVAVNTENERKKQANQANAYIAEILSETQCLLENWTNTTKEFKDSHSELLEQKWIESSYFSDLNKGLIDAKFKLSSEIESALLSYSNKIDELTIKHDEWELVQRAFQQTEMDFLSACVQQGLKPEELELLRGLEANLSEKNTQLDEKEALLETLSQSIEDLYISLDNLHLNWKAQTELKRSKLDGILSSGSIPTVASGQAFITVDIYYCQDKNHFCEIWDSPPQLRGNTRLGRHWEDIGLSIFNCFIQSDKSSPWEVLNKWLIDPTIASDEVKTLHVELKKYLEEDQIEYWQSLQRTRVNDKVNITLFRSDNTRAGSWEDNGLSDGQKTLHYLRYYLHMVIILLSLINLKMNLILTLYITNWCLYFVM